MRTLALSLLTVGTLLFGFAGAAQDIDYGDATGTVIDFQNNPIAHAIVSASRFDQGKEITEITETDGAGNWSLSSVIAADYTFTVRAMGFKDETVKGVIVNSQSPVRLNTTLSPF